MAFGVRQRPGWLSFAQDNPGGPGPAGLSRWTRHPTPFLVFCIAGTAALWILLTWLFWVGYAGADDFSYTRYAYLFHRPPLSWWEFRLLFVLAIRASFWLFGPSEFAAAIPCLASSVAIAGSVAWLVGWPRTLSWQSQAAMLLATMMPIDVGFRSYPAAPMMAAALLTLGTAAMLKGRDKTPYVGAVLLSLGFITHEVSFFYIAIFCLTAVSMAPRRFWRPVVCCIVTSATLCMLEMAMYGWWLGDPLARFRTAAQTTFHVAAGLDPDGEMSNSAFLLWPLQNLVYCKQFGFTLGALFVFGAAGWRSLSLENRILLATTFLLWGWLGYGSQVPWEYKPLYRQFHYYSPLVLGVAVLLPRALAIAFSERSRMAIVIVAGALGVHVVSLAAGGRWGAAIDVSRTLLAYATSHPNERFVTDVETFNQMYVVNEFRLPATVVAMSSPGVDGRLILNWEPPGAPRFRFPIMAVNGVLVNKEQEAQRPSLPEFQTYLRAVRGTTEPIDAISYRPLFVVISRVVTPRTFMIRDLGGDVIHVDGGGRTNQPGAPSP
jgi:hypothetical protein